jgi:hypothetical protein
MNESEIGFVESGSPLGPGTLVGASSSLDISSLLITDVLTFKARDDEILEPMSRAETVKTYSALAPAAVATFVIARHDANEPLKGKEIWN